MPFAFTEHGTIMAASVLNAPLAVEMSIFVVRAFVRMRSFLAAHNELALPPKKHPIGFPFDEK